MRYVTPALLVCAAIGCATLRKERIDKYYARSGLLTFIAMQNIDRRCPLVGLPSEAVRVSFGRPNRVEAVAADSSAPSLRWVYELARPGPVISVVLRRDTVVAWSANSRQVWRKVPVPPGYEWPRTKASALNAYLARHPDTPDGLVYAMARGCPQPGMTTEMLEATWGPPPIIYSVRRGDVHRLRWIYRWGVEGQNTQLEFEADSLVEGRDCGDVTGYRGPPECNIP